MDSVHTNFVTLLGHPPVVGGQVKHRVDGIVGSYMGFHARELGRHLMTLYREYIGRKNTEKVLIGKNHESVHVAGIKK